MELKRSTGKKTELESATPESSSAAIPSLQEISMRAVVDAIIKDPDSLRSPTFLPIEWQMLKEHFLEHILPKQILREIRRQRFARIGRNEHAKTTSPDYHNYEKIPKPRESKLCFEHGALTGMYLMPTREGSASYPLLHYLVEKPEGQYFCYEESFRYALGVLLAHSAETIDLVDADGNCASHKAVQQNKLDKVSILIAAGANFDLTNQLGLKPIDMASSPAQRKEIEQMLEARAEEDIAKAFERAVINCDLFQAVAALLAGADPDQPLWIDNRSVTVFDHAPGKIDPKSIAFFASLFKILPKFRSEELDPPDPALSSVAASVGLWGKRSRSNEAGEPEDTQAKRRKTDPTSTSTPISSTSSGQHGVTSSLTASNSMN